MVFDTLFKVVAQSVKKCLLAMFFRIPVKRSVPNALKHFLLTGKFIALIAAVKPFACGALIDGAVAPFLTASFLTAGAILVAA